MKTLQESLQPVTKWWADHKDASSEDLELQCAQIIDDWYLEIKDELRSVPHMIGALKESLKVHLHDICGVPEDIEVGLHLIFSNSVKYIDDYVAVQMKKCGKSYPPRV